MRSSAHVHTLRLLHTHHILVTRHSAVMDMDLDTLHSINEQKKLSDSRAFLLFRKDCFSAGYGIKLSNRI